MRRRQQEELMNVKHAEGVLNEKCAEIFIRAFSEVNGLVASSAELIIAVARYFFNIALSIIRN